MIVQRRYFDGRTGLQTTKPEQAEDAMLYERFGNARASQGAITRRRGIRRVGRITPANGPYCGDFDGSDDSVTVGIAGGATDAIARVWNLDGLSTWTLEILCQVADLGSQRTIFDRNNASDKDVTIYQDSTSGGRVVCELLDSGSATTTLTVTGIAAGTLTAIQLVKHDADSFTLRVNGSEATGTLASGALDSSDRDIFIGRSDSGEFYDGTIDFVRLLGVARPDQRDGWTRLVNPYARYVLADYCIEKDANDYVLDRSRNGLHASVQGSLATNVASLAVNPVPVQGFGIKTSPDNERVLAVIAGGRQYEATVR